MAAKAGSPKSDLARFDDLFAEFGPIRLRRMFGGEGVFHDGLMFALVDDERIFFKTSERSRQDFITEGCKPFTFRTKAGEGILTSYYAMPERLYDDPAALADWARAAFAVARMSPTAKKKQRTAPKRRD